MNQICDLHDSRVSGISLLDNAATITFDALYVHESTGQPGIDPGHGYYQKASLTISNATIDGPSDSVFTILEGWLRLGDIIHQNTLPLHSKASIETELHLTLTSGAHIRIQGSSYSIHLSATSPSFIERFPGTQNAAEQGAAANP